MTSPLLEIRLDKFAYGGEAMGRLEDGRAVFVPFALPGETVRVRLAEEKRNFARGELVEVVVPSPQRIVPRCAHFGECGGCHYQNLSYENQLAAKTEILRDQLTRIGKIENPPVRPIVPSPGEWNYRNHVQFHLTEAGKLGFVSPLPQGEGPGVRVISITECHLPENPINEFWPQLDFETDFPDDRISIRSGAGGDLMLVIESDDPLPPEADFEAGISAVHVFAGNPVVMAGDDHLVIEVLGRPFKVSAASFFQVNTPMAAKMVEHVLDLLPEKMDTLLDIYCGVGLFSAFAALRCQWLIGIEASPSACEDFAANLDEFDHVELYEAPAEDVLPALVMQIANLCHSYAIVDPPRAGLDKKVLDALASARPEAILYVSCDPSTLARDARRLIEHGYRLAQTTPFDLFPQTYHIESISLFTC
jgi:23S rRNA (uracil1939-C5)-methyltransferase